MRLGWNVLLGNKSIGSLDESPEQDQTSHALIKEEKQKVIVIGQASPCNLVVEYASKL